MSHLLHPFINIKRLILFLAFTAAIITLINGFYSSYQVQREELIKHNLEVNHAYATKLVSATENFLKDAQQQLSYSAKLIEGNIKNTDYLTQEADRLRLQTNSFNSVVITDAKGVVLATSPNTLQVKGKVLASTGSQQALAARKPLISEPFVSIANNLLIFISHPLFDNNGRYLGLIGGTLYLKERSVLNDLLGRHYQQDGSYLYVVDSQKRILYHPNETRIGTQVTGNKAVDMVLTGQSGFLRVTNTNDIEMLAGFAPVNTTNWGVISQRPVNSTLHSLDGLIGEVIYRTLPMGVLTFLLIWFLAQLISKPLQQLADTARTLDHPATPESLNKVKSWYFESAELKQAMLVGVNLLQTQIGKLEKDSRTDPLTGAHNRRSLDYILQTLIVKQEPFSVLAIDIDYFKRINDTHGHSVGDRALKELTLHLKNIAREHDTVARMGGEEFVMVLPNTSSENALIVAEKVREKIANTPIDPVGNMNISLGVASWPKDGITLEHVLNNADTALYQAKLKGRNRSIVYGAKAVLTAVNNQPNKQA
ncbi:diguanylate cyclase [Pseudoalteromonas sp. MMG010]|uniref:sensor domain-containing diguanylate cyclase n=1 Tax=Pseudoalteromonas sp. MMG010 TaxID=2822685 RepID=UPI001B39F214|nr:diguanylate cyclase [Pseudoalteromonas sp. MMG010]MBQ4833649.1 diguanylate cyclase [Pseudoalteromonas sp. MMG010]